MGPQSTWYPAIGLVLGQWVGGGLFIMPGTGVLTWHPPLWSTGVVCKLGIIIYFTQSMFWVIFPKWMSFVFFSHRPFCLYELSVCYLLIFSFSDKQKQGKAIIDTVLFLLKNELNLHFFSVKSCLFHGHVCDSVLCSSRTCKAQVSGYTHYFLSGWLSALTFLQKGLQPRLCSILCALGLGLCLASMLHWLPKPWWSSKRPNTVLVVDAPPPTSVSCAAMGVCVGGAHLIARSGSNDNESAAQPGSDACIIVVVAKCSWLIIPPSFANRVAAH